MLKINPYKTILVYYSFANIFLIFISVYYYSNYIINAINRISLKG